MAILGRILEVETETHCYVWKRDKVAMLWSEARDAIIWFDARPKAKAPKKDINVGEAIDAFERFVDRDAKKINRRQYDVSGPWVKLGRAKRIDYWSDKWGDKSGYTHTLGPNVQLYRQGPERGPWAFCLRGGNLRCTPRGLEG